jgi:flagellar transcriptional activator FlhD
MRVKDEEGILKINGLLDEIREINLSYLMLAQQMIRENQGEAMLRLGVSREVAELLAMLTAAQLMKLAGSNMLLCRFRVDDHMLLSALAHNLRVDDAGMQMAIMLAQQPVEVLQ